MVRGKIDTRKAKDKKIKTGMQNSPSHIFAKIRSWFIYIIKKVVNDIAQAKIIENIILKIKITVLFIIN